MIARILAALAFTLLSFSAFAQSDKCQLNYGGGHNGWGACGTGSSQNQQAANTGVIYNSQPVYSGQRVVYSNQPYTVAQPAVVYSNQQVGGVGGLTDCQAYGAIVGGTLGSLANNHRGQAVILGAIGGGLVGNMICRNSSGQQVIVQQTQAQQGIVATQPHVVQGGTRHYCVVAGRNIEVAPQQSCLALDDAVRAAQPVGQQVTQAQQPQGQAPSATPVLRNGQSCAAFTKDGRLVMDFLSTDRALNPLPAPVQTGEQCRAAKQQHAAG